MLVCPTRTHPLVIAAMKCYITDVHDATICLSNYLDPKRVASDRFDCMYRTARPTHHEAPARITGIKVQWNPDERPPQKSLKTGTERYQIVYAQSTVDVISG